MKRGVQQTPITLKLEKLRMEWVNAMKKQIPPKVIRWHVLQDEQRMVQGFMELETTEHGETPDLFFRFHSSFEEKEHYSAALLDEFITRYREDNEIFEELESEGISINWKPQWEEKQGNSKLPFKAFFEYLEDFLNHIPDFDGKLVLYLTPEECDDYQELEKWLMDAVEAGIPNKILFSVVDCNLYNWYRKLAADYPLHVASLRPDLKMYEAMKQMAQGGNPNDPDVQFRTLLFQINEAGATKKLGEMEDLGERAIKLTQKFKWASLETLIYFTLGGNFIQNGKVDEALERYDKALRISSNSYAEGNAEAAQMVIQGQMCKGAAYEVKGKATLSYQAYAEAGKLASEIGDAFKAMEGYRLAGKVCWENNFTREAMDYFSLGFEFGKGLREETRHNSTFLLLADTMEEAGRRLYDYEKSVKLSKDLEEWAGGDWKEKVLTFKTDTVNARR